jgi:hypothetical protein
MEKWVCALNCRVVTLYIPLYIDLRPIFRNTLSRKSEECHTVQSVRSLQTFRTNVLAPPSELKRKPNKQSDPEHRQTSIRLHGVTFQKTVAYVATALGFLNLTRLYHSFEI